MCDNAILAWESSWTINATASETGTAISNVFSLPVLSRPLFLTRTSLPLLTGRLAGGCLLPAPSASPSASPQVLLSNMTTIPTMPMLCFNLSAPAVLILPKGSPPPTQIASLSLSLGGLAYVGVRFASQIRTAKCKSWPA
jgi:hypothetical protein